MLFLVWCGLVCACMLCPWGGCKHSGEMGKVAGTTWRSESLESGVFVEESGWLKPVGTKCSCSPIQPTDQPANQTARATLVVPVVQLMPRLGCGTWPIYTNRKTDRDASGRLDLPRTAISCLCFVSSVSPFLHLLVVVPTQELFPRGSHIRTILNFPARVQYNVGMVCCVMVGLCRSRPDCLSTEQQR